MIVNPAERHLCGDPDRLRGDDDTLAKEVGSRGITVNVVAPDPTTTEMFLTGRPPEVVPRVTAAIPLGRLGEPDDVAGVVSFLAGPDGEWVNGQVIKVNGGRN